MSETARPRTSTRDPEVLKDRLVKWLQGRVDEPEIVNLSVPESNGMSSETLLFDARWSEERRWVERSLAARLAPDPSAAPVFPVYDLERQFDVMALVASKTDVPVPQVFWCETDPEPVGSPFFVMEKVEGLVPPDVMPYPFGSWLSEASLADQRRLQDAAVSVLVRLHDTAFSDDDISFLRSTSSGSTSLQSHVADQRAYYEWVVSDGQRSPLIEAGFAWLDLHWPVGEGETVLSWGDSRIGNMMFRDFEPVAVLDWEMVSLGPRGIDIGWMIYLHRFLDDIALQAGLAGMPTFMRPNDVVGTYEKLAGAAPRDLDFYIVYAALRHAIVMSRVARRQVLFGEIPPADDPDDMIMHRSSLEKLLEGTYWKQFEGS